MKASYSTNIIQGNDKCIDDSDFTVVIDVLRAFTVSKVLFEKGAEKIFLASDQHQALRIKQSINHPNVLLTGEIGGLKIPGFDLDNSPHNIRNADLAHIGEVVQMTTNGTKAALNAKYGGVVLVTGMTNTISTVSFIRGELEKWEKETVPKISFVASHPSSDEDVACAEYMIGLLENQNLSAASYLARVMAAQVAEKFLDPNNLNFDVEDINISASIEQSTYAMEVIFDENKSYIRKRMI